jgi:hypothetical protein
MSVSRAPSTIKEICRHVPLLEEAAQGLAAARPVEAAAGEDERARGLPL